jgi:hypothetical protein
MAKYNFVYADKKNWCIWWTFCFGYNTLYSGMNRYCDINTTANTNQCITPVMCAYLPFYPPFPPRPHEHISYTHTHPQRQSHSAKSTPSQINRANPAEPTLQLEPGPATANINTILYVLFIDITLCLHACREEYEKDQDLDADLERVNQNPWI